MTWMTLFRFTQALILDIAYGHTVNSDDDEYVELGEKGNHAFATVGRQVPE